MNVQPLLDRFFAHERRTVLFLRYILMVQQIIPSFAVRLSATDRRELGSLLEEMIMLSREIFDLPDLGTKPPDPVPFDPDCPEHLMSDHIRERIGRYNPTWDFANAPFTHPIGTELAMWCIDSQWNGFDTCVKALIAQIEQEFPDNPNIRELNKRRAELASRTPPERPTTDETLKILAISVSWEAIRDVIKTNGLHIPPEHAEDTFEAAKRVRNVRTHHFGEASQWLLRFMETHPFSEHQIRMNDGQMEVTTVFSRNAMETIKARTILLARNAQKVYS